MIKDIGTSEPVTAEEYAKRVSNHLFAKSLVGSEAAFIARQETLYTVVNAYEVLIKNGDPVIMTRKPNRVQAGITYGSLNVFVDAYAASNLFSRLYKDFNPTDLSGINLTFILLNDHVIQPEEIYVSNFSVNDIGSLVSDVLSARYGVVLCALREKFTHDSDLYYLGQSITQIYLNSGLSGVTSELRFGVSPLAFKSEKAMIFVFDYENSHMPENPERDAVHSYLEVSQDGMKYSSSVGVYNPESEVLSRLEAFTLFWVNLRTFISMLLGNSGSILLSPITILDRLILQQKVAGRIQTLDVVEHVIFPLLQELDRKFMSDTYSNTLLRLELMQSKFGSSLSNGSGETIGKLNKTLGQMNMVITLGD